MWLLKLHFSVSIMCLLTFIGFREIAKDQIKENGYMSNHKKKSIWAYWIFFIPIMNVMCVVTLFMMIFMKKNELEEFIKNKDNTQEDK